MHLSEWHHFEEENFTELPFVILAPASTAHLSTREMKKISPSSQYFSLVLKEDDDNAVPSCKYQNNVYIEHKTKVRVTKQGSAHTHTVIALALIASLFILYCVRTVTQRITKNNHVVKVWIWRAFSRLQTSASQKQRRVKFKLRQFDIFSRRDRLKSMRHFA